MDCDYQKVHILIIANTSMGKIEDVFYAISQRLINNWMPSDESNANAGQNGKEAFIGISERPLSKAGTGWQKV